MKTPKQKLIADRDLLQKLVAIVDNPQFVDLIQIAYNQYCWTLPPGTTINEAMEMNCRRIGAKGLIETLSTLTIPDATKTPEDSSRLLQGPPKKNSQ